MQRPTDMLGGGADRTDRAEMLMIEPDPCGFIARAAAVLPQKTLLRLMAIFQFEQFLGHVEDRAGAGRARDIVPRHRSGPAPAPARQGHRYRRGG